MALLAVLVVVVQLMLRQVRLQEMAVLETPQQHLQAKETMAALHQQQQHLAVAAVVVLVRWEVLD
jgi:hypothetical protein